jgi:hypothetical protein
MQDPNSYGSENIFLKKLESIARAIITNQVAMPLGATKIDKLIFQAQKCEAFKNLDLGIIKEYVSQFNGCPVGSERLRWDKEALKEQDKHLDLLTAKYKDRILDKCFEVLTRSF